MPADVETTPRASSPDQADTLQQYLLYRRHYFAYESALERAASLESFLDIACGLGPALDLVTARCERVIAVDVAKAALDALPERPNLLAQREDATRLSLEDDSVDVAVAFQLIEHVDTEAAKQIVREMRRVLAPGRRGFLTTPNARWRLLPGQEPWNRHHVREYDPDEMRDFCAELGIEESDIYGVIGVDGAQEIEKARVKPSHLAIWGGKPGRLAARCIRRLRRAGRRGREARRPVRREDREKNWFELSSNYREGIDFWIEVRK